MTTQDNPKGVALPTTSPHSFLLGQLLPGPKLHTGGGGSNLTMAHWFIFGSSSARSRTFELSFWYGFLEVKIMLGCERKNL
jgi:hypothetical protein